MGYFNYTNSAAYTLQRSDYMFCYDAAKIAGPEKGSIKMNAIKKLNVKTGILFYLFILLFFAQNTGVAATVNYYVPSGGDDTSDGNYANTNVINDDGSRDNYKLDSRNQNSYDETL